MSAMPRLKVLSDEEVSTIYNNCVAYLVKKGVKVEHPKALKILDGAGAHVDFTNQQVRFPKDMIEAALKSVPSSMLLAGSDPRHDTILPDPNGLFHVWASTGCRWVVEPVTNIYHEVTMADMAEYGQMIEALDNIDHGAFLTATDRPNETYDIHAMKAMLENTSKHLNLQPHTFESIEYLIELAIAVAGSSESLKKRPIIHIFSGSVAPFAFKPMDIEIIIQSCNYGLPLEVQSLTCMGATSPITIAGNVTQLAIDNLAQLVMSQIFRPGTPVKAAGGGSTLDMATGRMMMVNSESIIGSVASMQFHKDAFHVSTGQAGFGSDAFVPDGQSMMEVGLKGMIAALTGADMLSLAGRLCSGKAVSYIQLILDDTVASILKRIVRGVKVDEDTLAWKEIQDMNPAGNYLELAHTLKHCHDALYPELLPGISYDNWLKEGSKDLTARAVDKYRELKKTMKPLELPKEVQNELNRIVKHADEHLVK